MNSTFLSAKVYRTLFALLGVVYLIGLFVPLMDNDSAHHADIALHMYLTGDYISLIDHGIDYLDKPHLHFWLAAFSYHIFGVTGFAYKFPSFLFTILGIYSTYRIGKSLYNKETGKLAALIIATAFAFILANNDVRMDAILTASIAFATWQLIDWVHHKRWINVAGAALGLALGFSTKGHIAVATPAIGIFFYLLYKKDWKSFYHGQLLAIIALFFLFISPVVYSYYVQYDLHPEKVVRGRDHISGVKFILWKQNVERFQGESFGSDAKNDHFFFLHSFLWAFAPWSFLAYAAFFTRLKSLIHRRYEWLTIGTFAILLIMISASSFKLPHYLNIAFPVAAVFTASYLLQHAGNEKLVKRFAITQAIVCILCLLAAALINVWAFPATKIWVIVGFLVMVAVSAWMIKALQNKWQRIVIVSALTTTLIFYLLNANFYPRLLHYQAGNEMAPLVNKNMGGEALYFYEGWQSWSLNFYTKSLSKPFSDSLLNGHKKIWVVTDQNGWEKLQQQYNIGTRYSHMDYEITRLQFNFINPATRKNALNEMIIAEVLGKK